MTQVVLHYAHTFGICMFHYQFQSDLANGVCAFNLFMVGPLTMKFGTLISVHQNKFQRQ